ncbi:pentaheme c-type cytochrome TorC [Photobacterium sp. 1_MG-2023]|uniref:pentaheme c-type cytochrome TorC n=1 Tax=Photobacterium sp. 1_MG-2023 TaxID=3062646 RepID=UPI0026E3C7D0|nr:pentaheme c-type cytochrome TorC [Photobacterium sp. 1_MG-2023]MDO6706678.1 pentaheme c-type cytochrome TorC [Photobacterium sp. 1_MG-2023]
MKHIWHQLTRPSTKYSLLALLLIGIGLCLAGTFVVHKGFKMTSSLEFCTSCHTMQQNYEEYRQSVHFKNASGVQAVCTDCHQPKDFPGKVLRKLEAAKDLYHHFITGKIDTPEKFEDHRLEMAQKVWDRMESQNSKTCKSCHAYENMDHSKQSAKAAFEMQQAAAEQMNCIACHKGIAHELPNMAGGFQKDFQHLQQTAQSQGAAADTLYSLSEKSLYASADPQSKAEGQLLPASEVTVLERRNDMLRIRIDGWLEKSGKGRVLTEYMGKRVFKATIRDKVKATQTLLEEKTDPTTEIVWQQVTVEAWITADNMLDSLQPVWNYANTMYDATCNACHAAPDPAHFTANGWISGLNAMSAYYRLSKTEERTLLKYLQNHGKDTGGANSH